MGLRLWGLGLWVFWACGLTFRVEGVSLGFRVAGLAFRAVQGVVVSKLGGVWDLK